ncbi:alcohol dehydrogenase-like 2 [Citrus sinensis]|uniref:Alcohol dehydrogenase-like 2 n=1 Tax=Citrus sinensis TaxID=2711 RepID=A0ACB8KPZ0_CITSI|nr:alcohol dehydrogenase-like 2 [Citrus sinensis]
MPRDGTSRFRELKGDVIHHFLNISSFTEYTVVDITHVVKITPHIPLGIACLLTCGVSTGVGAAWKVAGVEVGSTVAIFGLGAVGLAVAEGARLNRASKIIGVDINPEKFEIGKKFGITDFINPATCGDKTVSQVIKEMTDGGADYCFECIGLASVMNDAFNSSREGWGKTVILGVEMHGSPISLNSIEILKGRSVCGTFFGGLKPKSDIATLAQKYLDKELNLDEFITHEVSFHDINKAFDLLLEGKIAAMVFGARFVRRTAASRGFRRGLLPGNKIGRKTVGKKGRNVVREPGESSEEASLFESAPYISLSDDDESPSTSPSYLEPILIENQILKANNQPSQPIEKPVQRISDPNLLPLVPRKVEHPHSDGVALHIDLFDLGLYLPLQSFFRKIFTVMKIAPRQLFLPGWTLLTGLEVLLLDVFGEDISYEDLMGLYQLKKPAGLSVAYFTT